MGLKKRSKVSATFSMSSLTDIIFLLLIFFMLTSSLVAPNALNLKLPGKGNPTTASSSPPEIRVTRTGNYFVDGRMTKKASLERSMVQKARTEKDMVIAPDPGTPVQHVVFVMDIAMRNHINTILATEK